MSDNNQSQQQGLSLQQALQLAAQHQAQGQLQRSENVLRQILQTYPNCAPAYHLLGIIAHQVGKTGLGVDLLGKAIAIDDTQALFHANRGEMCRILERVDEAIAHGQRAVALDPNSVAAHSNLGIAYYDSKDFDKAELHQKRALELEPNFGNALNNMGSICREKNDPDGAISYYQKAAELNPDYIEPLNNMGAVLVEEERPEEAIPILQKAITNKPDYAEAHCNLACSFRQLEQNESALSHFATALSLRPVYPEAHLGIAGIRLEEERPDEAKAVLTAALTDLPNHAELYALLGTANNELGYPDQAETAFQKAIEIDPELISAYNGLGTLKLEQGLKEDAERYIRRALELDAERIETLFNLSLVKTYTRDDEDFDLLSRQEADLSNLPEKKQMQLHFAMGKAFDDIRDYDRSFQHYVEGCRIKRSQIDYDEAATSRNFDQTISLFTEEFLSHFPEAGIDSNLPIFVLGMPRSGTTLTEQIIASHPDVHGAGELRDMSLIGNAVCGGSELNFPDNMAHATADTIRSVGAQYIAALQTRSPKDNRVTDKMPANFFFIGLIRMALPKAKIVHVNRNPVDTCVSNFARLFGRNQYQSYDLRELGRYYKNYQRLMAHWRRVLPDGVMYDLDYEDLVKDTEVEARRLVEYLELEWTDAVLDYSKTERQVRTASLTQVRQPIYTSSVERWRHYEKHLSPLLDELEGPP